MWRDCVCFGPKVDLGGVGDGGWGCCCKCKRTVLKEMPTCRIRCIKRQIYASMSPEGIVDLLALSRFKRVTDCKVAIRLL